MSYTYFLIPLQNIPQTFNISLNGVEYTMTSKWNDATDQGWVLDIADATSGDSLVAGIPLITGADCLAGLEYLGIGGSLLVTTNGDPDAVPTLDNLGIESNLYFATTATTTTQVQS